MDNIKKLIDGSISTACGEFFKVQDKHLRERDIGEKTRALARHFKINIDEVRTLKLIEGRYTTNTAKFNNTAYCLKQFLSRETRIIEEKGNNFESDTESFDHPEYFRLAIAPGESVHVWFRATIFFEWRGEMFCILFSPYGADEIFIKTIARTWDLLKEFQDVFDEYRDKNHYLRGKKFIGLGSSFLPQGEYSRQDIVLPEGMEERIFADINGVLKASPALAKYGLNSKKGFIFAGAPGNGKTLLLKIIANTVDATCILVPFDVERSIDVSRVFSLARLLAPTVIIFEDIDLYAEERGHSRDTERLGLLMNELDGMIDNREIVVIATTNHLKKVENALQNRPGRFDRVYTFPNPDVNVRQRILAHYIGRVPNRVSPQQVESLAEAFAGYSGAYLKELVNSGFAHAVLRDPEEPVLLFDDLTIYTKALQWKDDRNPIGFEIKTASSKEN
ncbi:MAG: ATP-binding protein [Candidatus Omnitrophica bacterium]|nr:ATP-binding protein [Candidatus Omnitrophota bacterium]